MQEPEIHEEIVHLLREMKHDYDYMAGDYDFVDAITRWALQLAKDRKQLLLECLFKLFKSGDTLGSYFCDVIVNLRETNFAPQLVALLPSPQTAKLKHKEIVRTLMRLEYKHAIPTYLDYIQTLLQHKDFSALTLLCHLYIVDSELAIREAAMYFARILDSPQSMPRVRAYIPCFIHIYCEQTYLDIIRLVQSTILQNTESGRRLAQLFLQAVSKPYEREKFAEDELVCLEQALKALSDSEV